MKFTIALIAALGFVAFSHADETSTKILSQIRKQTAPISKPTKSWPQNFGGQAAKLNLNKTDQLSKKAQELALSDEAVFQAAIKDVFFPLQTMIENQKIDFTLAETKDAQFAFKAANQTNAKNFDGINQFNWTVSKADSSFENFKNQFTQYVNEFSKIEYVSVSPFATSTPMSERDTQTSQPQLFNVTVRFDVRGLDKNQSRRNDRFTAQMVIVKKAKATPWKMTSFVADSGETLTATSAFFSEKNVFAEASTPANYLRREAIRRGGYALSMGDWNNDGLADLIVGHMGKVEFFAAQKDQTFAKVDNKKLGIEDETLVKSIVVNDFDNDGVKDLLFVRFAPSEQMGRDLITYKGLGESFRKTTSIKNRYPAYYAMPSAVADYNSDGLLDFYIGFPGAKDFTVLNKDAHGFVGLKEPHPQGLFYNTGKFEFQEVTLEKMPFSKKHNAYTDGYPELSAVFPHTSAGIDYDLDGHMDIVVVDDKANLSPLYKNMGDGTFSQVANKIGVVNSDFGMGFTAADLDNDGKLEFIYTNVNFLPAERLANSKAQNFSEYGHIPGNIGVKIFKTLDGKNYSDVTALSGIANAGEGVGGVEVLDYNNDGYMDIYVANGLWSGNSREQDLSSQFVRAYTKNGLDFQETMGTPSGVEEANTSFMKILTGFQGIIETGKAEKGTHLSMAGFQRNRLFRNNGNGTFTEVGYLAGVDSVADGYVVATADLNKDGKTDLILRNGDPGTDANRFPSVQVFQNNFNTKQDSVTLAFEGVKSNKDSIGVIAEATIGKNKIVRQLIANNGSIQSEPLLHFGLGDAKKIDKLTVRWPSGLVDEMTNVKAGFHKIKETVPPVKSAGL